jgi:hypothetical protein
MDREIFAPQGWGVTRASFVEMAEPEVRAADERLRGWLRRAGRSQAASGYGKNYGSTKNQEDDEDDEARAFVSKEVDEVGGKSGLEADIQASGR